MTTNGKSTKKDTQKAEALIKKTKTSKEADKSTPEDAVGGHEAQVDNLVRAHFVQNQAKAVFDDAEAPLLKIAADLYEKRAREGNPVKSIYLKGEEFPYICITFPDKFSSLKGDDQEVIIEAFKTEAEMQNEEAEAAFAASFKLVRTVKMKDTSDPTLALLGDLLTIAQMLADDNVDPLEVLNEEGIKSLRRKIRSAQNRGAVLAFEDLFESKVEIQTEKGMDHNQFNLPETIRQKLRQSKASTKINASVQTKAAADTAVKEVGALIIETIE